MTNKFCDDHQWVGEQGQFCPECEELDRMEQEGKNICTRCNGRGGEAEVLVRASNEAPFSLTQIGHLGWGMELVDRAHVTRLQAENGALQQRLNVADEQVDILSGGLRLMTSFGSGTNIAGVKTVAKQTLNRAAGVVLKADQTTPQ
ncbi:hypothetical protein ACIPL1_22830 [Pseudomonas sp. NPDC090202]|uniref:hypothetical protein n=1 Tax=Pseudomonas sp. NPDC090202 TaxID=3364476 RepID=UPI00380FD2D3